jgi:acyl dehydratase
VAEAGGPGPRAIDSVEALRAEIGRELGVSGWIPILQDRIDTFADATDDHQWIHVDVARATAESPYGGPIAHGYLTLSLVPRMIAETVRFTPRTAGINYGLDRARIRGRVRLDAADLQDATTLKVKFTVTVEIDGVAKPACIAETIALYLTG